MYITGPFRASLEFKGKVILGTEVIVSVEDLMGGILKGFLSVIAQGSQVILGVWHPMLLFILFQ